MEEYPYKVQKALSKNETIVMGVRCEVWYSGRAESYLPLGDRVVIIKSDNTLLIHQPEGTNPINYMKGNTKHNMSYDEGKLFLNCRNLALKEFLDVRIDEVHFFNSHKLEDGKSICIEGTEKDMAEMLYNNPELIGDGFKPLSLEEHTKYGFIDLFGYDKNRVLTVIECKRYAGDLKAVSQLRRYVEKIKSAKGLDNVKGVLACPRMSENAFKMLKNFGFEFVAVKPPKYLEKFDKKQKSLGCFFDQ